MAEGFRGVYTIPVTPFNPQGDVDEESLKREVDWCVRAGAHGIVAPVNASEGPALTDDERRRGTQIVTETTAGRIPVVIGVTGVSPQASILYTGWARGAAADAVIAMPPYGVRLNSPENIVAFYERVSDAADGLPVFVQNWSGPVGTPMGAELVTRLLREIPNVSYLKEETLNASHLMTEVIERAGDACKGVMGGIGGRFLLDEFRRGACGTMPACQITDIHVTIWNKLDGGDEEGARRIFNRLLPLLNMEAHYALSIYKEVLKRRGVIAHATTRGGGVPLDAYDHKELDAILSDVSNLFTI
ncbi:MAG TPA: dihydrodipicolinate synthase family protein [Thermomicrobiales bacterium]|nr:dihydrodipicolinate synthase family protein [Thermomicrobiales bacterium]